MKANVFLEQHWKYYLYLEKEVMSTFEYSTLDFVNENNFSFKYINLLQSICSEFDVIAKAYCKFLGNSKADSIVKYANVMLNKYPEIITKRINCFENKDIKYVPFLDWSLSTTKNPNGKSPEWWTIYNNVKHSRLSTNKDHDNKENYKLANQKFVMNALAGLYMIEMYFYKDIKNNTNPNDPKIPPYPSKLFEISGWDTGIMLSNGIYLKM
ncbi:MAG: hypothetical protein ACOX02_00300 [Acholeplasmatales bacterium]